MRRIACMLACLGLFAMAVGVSMARASDSAALDAFSKGNTAYKNHEYERAFEFYEEASRELQVSECYYNAGNAAFKANHLGVAILYYERAKRLDPRNADVNANLKYARSLVEYKVEEKRSWYYGKLMSVLSYVRLRECAAAWLIFYFIFLGLKMTSLATKGRVSWRSVQTTLVVCLIFFGILFALKFHQAAIERKGVVVVPKADVRYGPSKDDQLAFSLVEGIEFSVDDQIENWYRISLASGASGWIPKDKVEVVSS